jgi:hypothetical protein
MSMMNRDWENSMVRVVILVFLVVEKNALNTKDKITNQ